MVRGTWLITPGVKTPKHVFVFLQQTREQNSYTQNPYIFDTFNIDGDDSARLATCRLQYGTSFYPELDYDHDFKIRILNDLINFRYKKTTTTAAFSCSSPTSRSYTQLIYETPKKM